MTKVLYRFVKDESGATAIEYGLIAALVSVVIIGALTALGDALDGIFNEVATELSTATTPPPTTEGASAGRPPGLAAAAAGPATATRRGPGAMPGPRGSS